MNACATARRPWRASARCTRTRSMRSSKPPAARGMRTIAGKCLMDRNAPEALRDTAQRGYDESKALIERWHGKGRGVVCHHAAIRADEHAGTDGARGRVVERTSRHLSAVACVGESRRGGLGAADLSGTQRLPRHLRSLRTVRAARHLRPWHLARPRPSLRACTRAAAAIAHCPTSNLFLGSGLFDLRKAKLAGAARCASAWPPTSAREPRSRC